MHPRFERFIQGMNELTARPAVGEEDILREGRVLLGELVAAAGAATPGTLGSEIPDVPASPPPHSPPPHSRRCSCWPSPSSSSSRPSP